LSTELTVGAAKSQEPLVAPPGLDDVVGPIVWVRSVETKAKSRVMVLGLPDGAIVAKQADARHLKRERRIYQDVLPPLGIRAPRVMGWVETHGDPWLLVEHIDGVPPDLASASDRAAVSRWVARLHATGRAAERTIPARIGRVGPSERIEQLEVLMRAQIASGVDRTRELEACITMKRLLPRVLASAGRLEPALTHGDLAEQNLLMARDGVVAFDWDKAAVACPAIDLWLVDTAVYCDERRRRGAPVEEEVLLQAATAGKVLAALAHDIASKRPKRQRRYLDKMVEASERLQSRAIARRRPAIDDPRKRPVAQGPQVEGTRMPSARRQADEVDEVSKVVAAILTKHSGLAGIETIEVRPNEYRSRSRSWQVLVVPEESAPMQLFCKAGPGQAQNAIGDEAGIEYEARTYQEVLAPWGVAAPPFIGWTRWGSGGSSYLLMGALQRYLRVDKAPYPSGIVAAATWLGRSHRASAEKLGQQPMPRLNRYDVSTLRAWMSNALRATPSPRLRRIARLEEQTNVFGRLAGAEPTLVHGDCYPQNILVRPDDVRALDWEWAGIGAGEIDIAALTEAWNEGVERECVAAYAAARWPGGVDYDVHRMVSRARVYLYARWLGGRSGHQDPDGLYLDALERSLSQLGLRP
jgi:aminoglycoside phosphotransferase (APT) family kinase protein